ncbi:hypothetical protein BCR33DRAFT_726265 [Rhizoclosmatium globosum]|uniref:Zn(2)-C6 fungal-type domain-containing protein n=1 Tax=Rhizoclosmatium globosum TaxID=329046 RepID=A0A1Y2AVS5_9FUNG|nr:hypothetical protein BCR33DRAFT_726265 [Rhizoclosmatium globosum]|eukprot:ORY26400.1 hypothetical protein BCR33DRAFT_726265 [Rhizoclosmatium globosum]
MLLHEFPGQCLSTNRRLQSCEGCRLSNKKCTRTPVDEGGCSRCQKKGIACVYSKNSTRSKAYRELKEKKKLGLLGDTSDGLGVRQSPPVEPNIESVAGPSTIAGPSPFVSRPGPFAPPQVQEPLPNHESNAPQARTNLHPYTRPPMGPSRILPPIDPSFAPRRVASTGDLPWSPATPHQQQPPIYQPFSQPLYRPSPATQPIPEQTMRRNDVFFAARPHSISVSNNGGLTPSRAFQPPTPTRVASMNDKILMRAFPQSQQFEEPSSYVASMLPLSMRQQQPTGQEQQLCSPASSNGIIPVQHQVEENAKQEPATILSPKVKAADDIVLNLAQELVSFSRAESSMSISKLVD